MASISSVTLHILTPLVLVYILTKKEGVIFYGEYAIVFSLLAVFIAISDLGLSMEIPKRLIKNNSNNSKMSEIISIYIFIKIISALFLSLILYFLIPYEFSLKMIIIFSLILKAIDLETIFIGLEQYGFIASANLIIKLTYIALVVFLDLSESGIYKIFLAHLLVTLLGTIIYYREIFLKNEFNFNRFSFTYTRNILAASIEFYFARFFSNLYMQGSTYAISYLLTVDAIGVYSIAMNFYKAGISIIGGVGRVLYTYLIKTMDFDVLKSTTLTSIIIQACFFPIVFIFGGHFLTLLFEFDVSLLFNLSIFLYCSLSFSIINSYWGYPLFTAIKCDRIGHFCNITSAISYFIVFILLLTFREITIINAVICVVIADFIGAVLKLTFALNKKILP